MCQYSGIETPPPPEHPTKEQALDALDVLCCQQLRFDAVDRYRVIVKRFIEDLSKEVNSK